MGLLASDAAVGVAKTHEEKLNQRIEMIFLDFLLRTPSFRCAIEKESEKWLIECDAKIQQISPFKSFTLIRGRDRLDGYNLNGRVWMADQLIIHSGLATKASETEMSGPQESFCPKNPGYIRLDYVPSEWWRDEEKEPAKGSYEIHSHVSRETLHHLLKLNWETHDVHLTIFASENQEKGNGLAWAGANYEWRHDGEWPVVQLSSLHLRITTRQNN